MPDSRSKQGARRTHTGEDPQGVTTGDPEEANPCAYNRRLFYLVGFLVGFLKALADK